MSAACTMRASSTNAASPPRRCASIRVSKVHHAAPPAGWEAPRAGLHPRGGDSAGRVPLVAGRDREPLLDRQPPRPVAFVPGPVTVVGLDCDLPDAVRWDLAQQQVGAAMLAELR